METIDNTLEGQALLLEQCRLDMDKLAENGDAALREAIAQAKRQANACQLDWEQSHKAVELTAQQRKSLEQTRALGEEKLTSVQADEEDARLAVETVQGIISDTVDIQDDCYLEAVGIFAKASSALEETVRRARLSYAEKRAHTEEVLASLRRLSVAEKYADYTLAKAERNASEKKLFQLIAAHRHQICAAEYEVIKCREQTCELQARLSNETQTLQELDELLTASRKLVLDKQQELNQAQSIQSQEWNRMQNELEASLTRIDEQLAAQHSCRETATLRAEELQQEVEARQKAGTEALAHAAQVAKTSSDSIASAHAHQQQALQEMENELTRLRQEADERRQDYEQTLSTQDNCFQLADKAKELEQKCEARAQAARDEEAAAAKAASTALRLAESATRVRGSIGSESSNLLQQAQEVMQEASLSAQLLLDEKRARLREAEAACQQSAAQSEAAAQAVGTATERVDAAHSACLQAEEKVISHLERSEALKREWEERTAAAIADAEKTSASAEAEAEAQRQFAQTAKNALAQAQSELSAAVKYLEQLEAEKRSLEESGDNQLQAARSQAASDLARLQDELSELDTKLSRREETRIAQAESINKLCDSLEQARDRERSAEVRVEELINLGALEIVTAGEEVDGCRNREEAARQARMEAETEAVRQNIMASEQEGLASLQEGKGLEDPAAEQEILSELETPEEQGLSAPYTLRLSTVEELPPLADKTTDAAELSADESADPLDRAVTEDNGPELIELATPDSAELPPAANMSGFLIQASNHSVVRDFVRSVALAADEPAAPEAAEPEAAEPEAVTQVAAEPATTSQTSREWPSFGSIFTVDPEDKVNEGAAYHAPKPAPAEDTEPAAAPEDAATEAAAAMPASLGAAFKEWMHNLSQSLPDADSQPAAAPPMDAAEAAPDPAPAEKAAAAAENREPEAADSASYRTDGEGNYDLEVTAPFSPEEDALRLLILNSVDDTMPAAPADTQATEALAPARNPEKPAAKRKLFSFFS